MGQSGNMVSIRVDSAAGSTPSRGRQQRWLGGMWYFALAAVLVAGPFADWVGAQGKAAKKPTKAELEAAEEAATASPFTELTFGEVALKEEDEGVADLDETPEGQERLGEVTARAREIFRERDGVEKERRPIAAPRDVLQGEVNLLTQNGLAAQQQLGVLNRTLGNLNRSLARANSENEPSIRNQIANVQGQISNAQGVITGSQNQIVARQPRLDALNNLIRPLDERLKKLWEELNSCRKQWLELRQPQRKYSHASFESLKRVLDDWLRIDGLWPDALCWSALCEFELGNYDAAWDQVEKAGELRNALYYPKSWAHGEALRGLIAAKIKVRKPKAAAHLQSAMVHLNKKKNSDWQTYFLLGRAYYDNDKMAPKSKGNFEKAMGISPDAPGLKFWYGRLLSTSTNTNVRDVKAGTKMLENLWERSAKKSWRLSSALVFAYDTAQETEKAKQKWDLTLELAPKSEHDALNEMRASLAK